MFLFRICRSSKKFFFNKTFFQSGLCRFFRGKLRKTFFRKHYVLVQNLLFFKKVFFNKTFSSIWTLPFFQRKTEKNFFFENTMFLFRICCSSKKFFSIKLFLQSGLCRFFREKLRKTFLRKHYVLVQNLLLFKEVFFQ